MDPEWGARAAANRANWDERVRIHVDSAFYDHAAFLDGRDSLQPWEVREVGEVAGRDLVHLQCHFGHDTLSWGRRGARVTGLDFSPAAIDQARADARAVGVDARFVVADVYDAVDTLEGETFDIVYTSHGVLTWLPDIRRWAEVVAGLTRVGGTFYISEFHPILWAMDHEEPRLAGDYFEDDPFVVDEPGTYTDLDAPMAATVTYEWQHTLGDVVTALASSGFVIEFLHERPVTLWRALPWLERHEDGTYRPPAGAPVVPLSFSLRARMTDGWSGRVGSKASGPAFATDDD